MSKSKRCERVVQSNLESDMPKRMRLHLGHQFSNPVKIRRPRSSECTTTLIGGNRVETRCIQTGSRTALYICQSSNSYSFQQCSPILKPVRRIFSSSSWYIPIELSKEVVNNNAMVSRNGIRLGIRINTVEVKVARIGNDEN